MGWRDASPAQEAAPAPQQGWRSAQPTRLPRQFENERREGESNFQHRERVLRELHAREEQGLYDDDERNDIRALERIHGVTGRAKSFRDALQSSLGGEVAERLYTDVRGLLGDENALDTMRRNRAQRREVFEAHPVAGVAGGVAGALVPAGAAGKLALAQKGAGAALRTGAIASGAEGTAFGYGGSQNEGVGGVARDALTTGAISAAASPVAVGGGELLARVARKFGAPDDRGVALWAQRSSIEIPGRDEPVPLTSATGINELRRRMHDQLRRAGAGASVSDVLDDAQKVEALGIVSAHGRGTQAARRAAEDEAQTVSSRLRSQQGQAVEPSMSENVSQQLTRYFDLAENSGIRVPVSTTDLNQLASSPAWRELPSSVRRRLSDAVEGGNGLSPRQAENLRVDVRSAADQPGSGGTAIREFEQWLRQRTDQALGGTYEQALARFGVGRDFAARRGGNLRDLAAGSLKSRTDEGRELAEAAAGAGGAIAARAPLAAPRGISRLLEKMGVSSAQSEHLARALTSQEPGAIDDALAAMRQAGVDEQTRNGFRAFVAAQLSARPTEAVLGDTPERQ